jgi:hypothetical protein
MAAFKHLRVSQKLCDPYIHHAKLNGTAAGNGQDQNRLSGQVDNGRRSDFKLFSTELIKYDEFLKILTTLWLFVI